MKLRVAFILILSMVMVAGGLWMSSQKPAEAGVRIRLRSDPYPMAVGWVTLSFSVVNGDGSAVDNAAVFVTSEMMHPGMLPINQQAVQSEDGDYQVSVNWPMTGQWTVSVAAELPEDTIEDQFEVFVYPVQVDASSNQTPFRSASEIAALVSDPEHEMQIVIPQGTQQMIRAGEGEDVIPTEIHLNVNGVNTLVIQNNDIVDHKIGPYQVRSGEVIRQKFTRPSVYQGVCSLNAAAAISIIVEE